MSFDNINNYLFIHFEGKTEYIISQIHIVNGARALEYRMQHETKTCKNCKHEYEKLSSFSPSRENIAFYSIWAVTMWID